MTATHWTLAQTLQRRGVTTHALIKASGLAKGTVYDIVNGKSQGITLETVDRLLSGLEQLTGERLSVEAVLAREEPADPYAHLFVNARPYEGYTPPNALWTDEERAEDDKYWAEQEAEKRRLRALPDKRMQQLTEIFGDDHDNGEHDTLDELA